MKLLVVWLRCGAACMAVDKMTGCGFVGDPTRPWGLAGMVGCVKVPEASSSSHKTLS
jgi:hypothetical protein